MAKKAMAKGMAKGASKKVAPAKKMVKYAKGKK